MNKQKVQAGRKGRKGGKSKKEPPPLHVVAPPPGDGDALCQAKLGALQRSSAWPKFNELHKATVGDLLAFAFDLDYGGAGPALRGIAAELQLLADAYAASSDWAADIAKMPLIHVAQRLEVIAELLDREEDAVRQLLKGKAVAS